MDVTLRTLVRGAVQTGFEEVSRVAKEIKGEAQAFFGQTVGWVKGAGDTLGRGLREAVDGFKHSSKAAPASAPTSVVGELKPTMQRVVREPAIVTGEEANGLAQGFKTGAPAIEENGEMLNRYIEIALQGAEKPNTRVDMDGLSEDWKSVARLADIMVKPEFEAAFRAVGREGVSVTEELQAFNSVQPSGKRMRSAEIDAPRVAVLAQFATRITMALEGFQQKLEKPESAYGSAEKKAAVVREAAEDVENAYDTIMSTMANFREVLAHADTIPGLDQTHLKILLDASEACDKVVADFGKPGHAFEQVRLFAVATRDNAALCLGALGAGGASPAQG